MQSGQSFRVPSEAETTHQPGFCFVQATRNPASCQLSSVRNARNWGFEPLVLVEVNGNSEPPGFKPATRADNELVIALLCDFLLSCSKRIDLLIFQLWSIFSHGPKGPLGN